MNSHTDSLNLVGTRSTASVIPSAENGTRWNASLPKRGVLSLSASDGKRAGVKCAFPLRRWGRGIKGEVVSFALLLLLSTFYSQPLHAADCPGGLRIIARTGQSVGGQTLTTPPKAISPRAPWIF